MDPPGSESPSEREPADQESSVALQDPYGPSLSTCLAQKLFRDKRLGDIPGWFDRWDVFMGAIDLEGSIAHVEVDSEQAALRRSLWASITIHLALLTSLMAIGIYVPYLASLLEVHFSSGGSRAALYVALLLKIVVLKLTLDTPILRWVLFSLYLVTLAVVLASSQLAFAHPSVLYCSQLSVLSFLVILLLCGVQRKTNEGPAGFLGHLPVACIASIVVIAVASLFHFFLQESGPFKDDDHFTLAVLAIIVIAFAGAYEAELLGRTLMPEETWLAVCCVHFDLHVITLVIPAIVGTMLVGGLLGLAIGTPLELLWQAFAYAYGFVRGGSTFGIVWNLKGCFRQTSTVGVEPTQAE